MTLPPIDEETFKFMPPWAQRLWKAIRKIEDEESKSCALRPVEPFKSNPLQSAGHFQTTAASKPTKEAVDG